jgi:hypothetical protein
MSVPMMANEESGWSSTNRQSVGWFADRAADVPSMSPVDVQRLPSTAEEEEEEDIYERAAPANAKSVPEILVEEATPEPQSTLMADIDKGVGECFSILDFFKRKESLIWTRFIFRISCAIFVCV